ncbi:hypothetical protein ACHAWX_005217 [Stephanocyclus meneghinianus]
MFEADGGLGGEYFYIEIPKDATTDEQRCIKTITRSHHVSANSHKDEFCHGVEKHSMCIRAVAVLQSLASSTDIDFTMLNILSIRFVISV